MAWFGRLWRAALAAAPLRLWAMMFAGPAMLGSALWLANWVGDTSWPVELRDKQLDFLGWAMIAFIGINAIIIVTLAAARVRASGPGGTSLEIDADNKPENPDAAA